MTYLKHYSVHIPFESKEQASELADKLGGKVHVTYGLTWLGLGGPIAEKPKPATFSLLGSLLRTYQIVGSFTLVLLAGYGIAEMGPVWLIYLSARYGPLPTFAAMAWIIMSFASLLTLISDTTQTHSWHEEKK